MTRMCALILALVLIVGVAIAEGTGGVSDYVSRQGFKAIASKNRSKIAGCWFTSDADGETLRWSDKTGTYTVTAKAGKGLRDLYADVVAMGEWDTCSFTEDGKVQYAYNAPEVPAVKSYKTLQNYVRYVTEHIDKTAAPASKGRDGKRSYIINLGSKRFHLPNCSFVDKIKKGNKERFTGTRKDLIAMGYTPCKQCDP